MQKCSHLILSTNPLDRKPKQGIRHIFYISNYTVLNTEVTAIIKMCSWWFLYTDTKGLGIPDYIMSATVLNAPCTGRRLFSHSGKSLLPCRKFSGHTRIFLPLSHFKRISPRQNFPHSHSTYWEKSRPYWRKGSRPISCKKKSCGWQ